MTKFIFTNRSYLLGFNFPAKEVNLLSKLAVRNNFKFINETELAEFAATLGKIRHLIGVFLDRRHIEEAVCNNLIAGMRKNNSPYRLVGPGGMPARPGNNPVYWDGNDADRLIAYLDDYLAGLVPARLEELLLRSANFILPFIFPEVKAAFRPITDKEKWAYDLLVTCDSVGKDVVGNGVFKVNIEKLRQCCPSYRTMQDDKILDGLRELANQFLGVVNHNLGKIGVEASIGLPVTLDMKKTFIARTSVYCPAVCVADECNIFLIEFGLVNTEGKPLVAFDDVVFDEPPDDIELF